MNRRKQNNPIQYLDDAIQYLHDNKIENEPTVLECFDVIKEQSISQGLKPDDITSLVDLICNKKMLTSQQNMIIKSLIPESFVPAAAAVKIILAVFGQTLTKTSKINILKWVTAVFGNNLFDNKNELHKLYDALFTYLNHNSLAPFISHLLHYLTIKEDVTDFRVSYIQDVVTEKGPKPYLLCLWNCYFEFRADITRPIEGHAYFESDVFWDRAFDGVLLRLDKSVLIPEKRFQKKKRKLTSNHLTNIPVESLSMLDKVIERARTQMTVKEVAISSYRRLVFSSSTEILFKKFNFWFASISEEMWNSRNPETFQMNPFAILTKLCFDLPCTFSGASAFLFDHLQEWDGVKMFKDMMLLVPLILPGTIEELCPILNKLHELVICSSLEFQCLIIALLSELFRNWVLHGKDNIHDQSLLEIWSDTTFMLGSYIDKCVIICLQLNPSRHTLVLNCAFDFYFEVAQLVCFGKSNVLLIPSPTIVSFALFSLSGHLLSRLCQLFLIFEKAVQLLKKTKIRPLKFAENIELLNAYIRDTCNVLLFERAFLSNATSSLFRSEIPINITNALSAPGATFSLFRHPALLSTAYDFAENHNEHWPQNVRNEASRNSFVKHLNSSVVLKGIYQFFLSFQ